MKSATPQRTVAEELVECLAQIDEEVPLENADVELLLKEAGINAQASLNTALAMIGEAEQKAKKQRYLIAEQTRAAVLKGLETKALPRTRAELQKKIAFLKHTLPAESQPHANFKGLESVPDEDLEMLVAELELLVVSEHDPK